MLTFVDFRLTCETVLCAEPVSFIRNLRTRSTTDTDRQRQTNTGESINTRIYMNTWYPHTKQRCRKTRDDQAGRAIPVNSQGTVAWSGENARLWIWKTRQCVYERTEVKTIRNLQPFITSYVAVNDHVTPWGAWLDCKAKLLAKVARTDCEKMIANLR